MKIKKTHVFTCICIYLCLYIKYAKFTSVDSALAEQGLEKSEATGTQAISSEACTAQLFANSAMSSVYSPTA